MPFTMGLGRDKKLKERSVLRIISPTEFLQKYTFDYCVAANIRIHSSSLWCKNILVKIIIICVHVFYELFERGRWRVMMSGRIMSRLSNVSPVSPTKLLEEDADGSSWSLGA